MPGILQHHLSPYVQAGALKLFGLFFQSIEGAFFRLFQQQWRVREEERIGSSPITARNSVLCGHGRLAASRITASDELDPSQANRIFMAPSPSISLQRDLMQSDCASATWF